MRFAILAFLPVRSTVCAARLFELSVILLGTSATCAAQSAEPLVAAYNECFLRSTRHQFLADLQAEPNMVAERAFQACATEEAAIYSYLMLNGLPPANARAAILTRKLKLKRQLITP